jgi:hypothetical protein
VFSRFLDQAVYERKIEFAFRRFDQFPVDGDQNSIEIERDEFRPYGPHVFEARRRRIAQFAAEDEKRGAVHNELRRLALFAEVWE